MLDDNFDVKKEFNNLLSEKNSDIYLDGTRNMLNLPELKKEKNT